MANDVNPPLKEAYVYHEERLLNLSLSHIQLDDHIWTKWGKREVMNHLLGNEDIITDESSLDKATLIRDK